MKHLLPLLVGLLGCSTPMPPLRLAPSPAPARAQPTPARKPVSSPRRPWVLAELTGSGAITGARVATSGPYVFWTDPEAGTVKRVRYDGTGVRNLASGLHYPSLVVVDRLDVFVTSGIKTGSILKMRLNGTRVQHMPDHRESQIRGLSIGSDIRTCVNGCKFIIEHADVLVWSETRGEVVMVPADRSAAPEVMVSSAVADMAASDGWFYWISYDSAVYRMRPRMKPQRLATSPRAVHIAVDDEHVYWTTMGTYTPDEHEAYTLGTYNNDGSVRRVRKTGGTAEIVASHQRHPGHLALSDSHIFWINDLDGELMSLPKP